MTDDWYFGSANDDAGQHRGWLMGHFVNPEHGQAWISNDVEIKWGIHPAGDTRAEWTADDQRTTVVILVSGRFRLDLTVNSTTLQRQGDYVVWGPGIDHFWQAEEDSVVVTVRWPSRTD